jgi:hypothetical protein
MKRHPAREILFILLKFLIIAPICMVLWWWALLTVYSRLLGQVTGMILLYVVRIPVEAVKLVSGEGILNTNMLLQFTVGGRPVLIETGLLTTNIVPFCALVLATPRLGWKRRLSVLLLGTAILVAGHVLYLVLALIFSKEISEHPQIPKALGQLFLTLPFLLWIVLAYWQQLGALIGLKTKEKATE